MTTSRKSPASWLGINEFSGGGSKMLEDNLLVSPIWSIWVIFWQLQWTKPRCSIIIFVQSCQGKHLKPASLEESVMGYMEHSISCWHRDWRRTNIAPVFKRGDKHSPSNYRPVSLTSLMMKCLECLVYARLSEFLGMNNKLSSCQHGFRRGHSCQTQLLATTHEWAKSLNKGVSTHVIYLDFSKAFDSVPHQRRWWNWIAWGSGAIFSVGL